LKKPFSAYCGAEPYLFLSYAHLDQDTVYSDMEWLYEAGFNIWYDEGIDIGSVWRQSVADALAESSGCLFFLTQNSILSENCRREILFALEEGVKIFTVRLDDTPLTRELKYSLSDRQALVKDEYGEQTYREQLKEALMRLAVKGPARILERPGSQPKYRTKIPLLCVNPFTSRASDEELQFYAQTLAADVGRCMFGSSYYVTEGRVADSALEPEEVGRKHRAQYVLNGTLIREDEKIRVSARIFETQHGKQVWADNFMGSEGSLGESIARIASELAAIVTMTFHQYEQERLRDIPELELDAWGLSIRSMTMPLRDHETAQASIRVARLAVERDDGFAEAHANLADVLVSQIITMLSDDIPADSRDALDHCNKALILNKDAVYVLNRCSRVHRVLGSEALALQIARRVDSLTIGEFTYTLYPALILNGFPQEVVTDASDNPRATHSWVSDAYTLLGEFAAAESWARTSVARGPSSYMGWMRLANVLGHIGQREEGCDILERVGEIRPPGWTKDTYKLSLRLNWRDKTELVDPLFAGIRQLESYE
jgi:TolB-like protein